MKKKLFENWPLVTVYIVTKNHAKFVKQAIKSVIKQTYLNWELYIIDDNSKDKSFEIAKNFKKNKKISFIKYKKNIGLQKIANEILKKSKGKYFIRLDGDDWFDENALLNLVSKIDKNNSVSAIYGSYYYSDEKGMVIGEEKNTTFNRNFLPPHGACTLFRTRSLKEVGGYSEKISAQDGWEMWLKLKERYKIISTTTSIFFYRQHSKSLTKKTKILGERNKIINNISKKLLGDYSPVITAIIPVKNNFKNEKNISMKTYRGKKLIDIALRNIQYSKLVNNLVVTTKDQSINEYIKRKYKKLKNFYFIKRPDKFEGSIKLKEMVRYVDKNLKNNYKFKSDIFIFLNLHILNLDINYLDKLINVLLLNKYDTVFTVTKERNPIFKLSNHKMKILNEGRFSDLEYRDEIIYKFNGAAIALWSDALEKSNIFKDNIGFIEIDENKIKKIIN